MPPDTRDEIVYSALRLFAQKGYASTSVADILQAADVNAGSLYHFFPGKQDVLLAVLDAYRHGIHPMLLEPAWKGVERSDRARVRAARAVPAGARVHGLHVWLSDRQHRARDARARSAGSRAACRELRRLDRRDRAVLRRRGRPAADDARSARARGVRAHDDGRRRHAVAHGSHARRLR